MTLPPEHLRYPARRGGMDHDRYPFAPPAARPRIEWPGGARLALLVAVPLEWFPLDMPAGPIRPPGALDEPYPDYRNYSHRDYGLRVGVFRLMTACDRLGLSVTAPVNAAVCERAGVVIDEGLRRGWEFVGHGLDMGRLHHGGLPRDLEAAMVTEALGTVRRATGQPVRGWLSPAHSESFHTLDLLAERGIAYVGDWANDDRPYPLRTAHGPLVAMPFSHELDDATVIWQRHHGAAELAEQFRDQCDWLDREAARDGGRVLAVTLRPWISGQPHRIRAVEQALTAVARRPGVWTATAGEILDAFTERITP